MKNFDADTFYKELGKIMEGVPEDCTPMCLDTCGIGDMAGIPQMNQEWIDTLGKRIEFAKELEDEK